MPQEIKPTAIYDVEEISQILNVSDFTVMRYYRTGKLRGQKFGRNVKFMGESLIEFLKGDGLPKTRPKRRKKGITILTLPRSSEPSEIVTLEEIRPAGKPQARNKKLTKPNLIKMGYDKLIIKHLKEKKSIKSLGEVLGKSQPIVRRYMKILNIDKKDYK